MFILIIKNKFFSKIVVIMFNIMILLKKNANSVTLHVFYLAKVEHLINVINVNLI